MAAQSIDHPHKPFTKPPRKPLGKTKQALKQRAKIIAKAMISGSSAKDALVAAGYDRQNATTQTAQVLSNPIVMQTFNELLDKAGLSDSVLAEKINALSNAKKTLFFAHKGEVVGEKEVEALDIQADMVKFATKVKGHVVDKTQSNNVSLLGITVSEELASLISGITGAKKPIPESNQIVAENKDVA